MKIKTSQLTDLAYKLTDAHYLFFGCLFLFCYFLPYIALGFDSHILIHDNLDCTFVWASLLAKTGMFSLPNDILPNIMNGLPMAALPSKLNSTFFFFLFFDPLPAYLLNELFIRFIAFLGTYLLLDRHVLSRKNLAFFIALVFCVLPFYSMLGLSVAGQPLLLFSFFNLLKRRYRLYDFAIIALFGFSSSIIYSGFFILSFVFFALIGHIIGKKEFPRAFFLGMLILSISYVVSEYQLFYLQFFSDFAHHRSEWVRELPSLFSSLKSTIHLALRTQYHTGGFSTRLIILSAALSFFVVTLKKETRHHSEKPVTLVTFSLANEKDDRLYLLFFIVIFILSTHFAYPHARYWLGDTIGLLKTIQFDRFYFLLPLVWFLIFAIALERMIKNGLFPIAALLIVLQLVSIVYGDRVYPRNIIAATRAELLGRPLDLGMNFRRFFDEELFSNIEKHIGKNQEEYRVVSIGLHPSIAQYNGFFTLDGYQTLYPADYKAQFRKIIECELEKSPSLTRYFDDWGSRCYVFSSELGRNFLIGKKTAHEINSLCLNTKVLKEMGGEYVLSTVRINNHLETNLAFEGAFETEDSFWRIYLYRVALDNT